MLLYKSFRDELVEQIQAVDLVLFKDCEKSKDAVLADNDLIDRMWRVYQKDIEEYGLDALEALRDTLEVTLGIPATD